MPSFVMHHYFAARVCELAPPELARICTAAPAAYSWGSQGPDPFFFIPLSGASAQLGGRMHRGHIAEVFRAMAQAAHGSAVALAYLLGFCTHYALDRTVHPYIETQTQRLMKEYQLSNSAAHKLCEADLDAEVLRWRGVTDPAKEPAYKLLNASSPEVPEAARMLAAAGNAVGGQVTAAKAAQAMHLIHLAYAVFHYGRGSQKGIVLAERALSGSGFHPVSAKPAFAGRHAEPLPQHLEGLGRGRAHGNPPCTCRGNRPALCADASACRLRCLPSRAALPGASLPSGLQRQTVVICITIGRNSRHPAAKTAAGCFLNHSVQK